MADPYVVRLAEARKAELDALRDLCDDVAWGTTEYDILSEEAVRISERLTSKVLKLEQEGSDRV